MNEDKNLFEEYFNKYKDDVYRVAYYYTKNKDDAEDLLQDTFIRAYRFFYRFKKNTNFKSWILKIMRNIYITGNKKKQREHAISQNIELIPDKSYLPEADSLNSVTITEMKESILMLPREFREVIILSDIEGLMYEEIAKIIKIPVGTVRSRLHRGRLILKERLRERYNVK